MIKKADVEVLAENSTKVVEDVGDENQNQSDLSILGHYVELSDDIKSVFPLGHFVEIKPEAQDIKSQDPLCNIITL